MCSPFSTMVPGAMSCAVIWTVVIVVVSATTDSPVTTISQGTLVGKWLTTREGRQIAAFIAIPYAQPPVGQLRFKSPEPAKSWGNTVFNATTAGPWCVQGRPPYGQEDCLHLNVFTPNTNPPEKYAVMVFIHGGSFLSGSSDPSVFSPEYILDEDVILVTLNYRLGVLGFLSLEHPVLPGNLGLKDQREALRWVKKNIAAFGGDPDKVTITGNSAGSASTHFLSLFATKEGLFRGAILDSKSAMSLSAFNPPGAQRRYVDIIAEDTRCPREPAAFIECLRELPAQDFIRLNRILSRGLIPGVTRVTTLCPMVEPESVSDRLVTADPLSLNTDLPLMVDNTEMEGLLYTSNVEKDKTDITFETVNTNFDTILPHYLQFIDYTIHPQHVARDLKDFYLRGKPISRNNYIGLVDMYSDAHYNYGQVLAARANKNKTYFSRLTYRGANSVLRLFGNNATVIGVTHSDNLFYLFPLLDASQRNFTQEDTDFSKKYVKLWTNFVRFQDPTPEGHPVQWTPVESDNIKYLNIGQEHFKMEDNYLHKRMAFWDSLSHTIKFSGTCSKTSKNPSCNQ